MRPERTEPGGRVARSGLEGLQVVAGEWDALAVRMATPFMTLAWLRSWWRAFGIGEAACLTLRDGDGSLRAGCVLAEVRGG